MALFAKYAKRTFKTGGKREIPGREGIFGKPRPEFCA